MKAIDPSAWISALFEEKGSLQYGEDVTQLQHALQCGLLALQAGASEELALAAVLHDVGHMLHRDAALALAEGRDDAHEVIGAKALAKWFKPGVIEPIRLHVQAKRYLCAQDSGYWHGLSELSKQTLQMQGGPMKAAELAAFETQPYWRDAVSLRRWDDAAKESQRLTPSLEQFLERLPAALIIPPTP